MARAVLIPLTPAPMLITFTEGMVPSGDSFASSMVGIVALWGGEIGKMRVGELHGWLNLFGDFHGELTCYDSRG